MEFRGGRLGEAFPNGVDPLKLTQILSSPERTRLFPVTREGIFLAHAAVAPITGPAREAMDAWNAEAADGRQESEAVWKRVAQTRAVAARFLGCDAEEVSLLGPTALGLGLVALGLDWKAGDEVIFDPLDYPANVYPWKELQRKGVQAVPIQRNPGEPIRWENLRSLTGPKTRLVSLATAHYLSGHRPDLSGIGPELKKRNILLCLDGIQTLGVLPATFAEADFLAADAHKWMLGPVGAGVLMVRKRAWERLRPPLLGSWNVVSPEFLAQSEIRFESGGRRYEPGSLNLPGIEGMRASLELLEAIGLSEVSDHALALARQVREEARRAGFAVYGGEGEDRVITSLVEPSSGWNRIKERMEAAKIRVSWRKEHGGKMLLRVSPHLSNTREEIGEFLRLLKN
ncbi:MAG: aminotransferase class V-fold PLP-dependent enzyme [Verrucomicrobia bacterium]|nr:aminotransferase class V-fold PLP-dependent enzyme [Verrucomicrobiota bacterium]